MRPFRKKNDAMRRISRVVFFSAPLRSLLRVLSPVSTGLPLASRPLLRRPQSFPQLPVVGLLLRKVL